MRRLAIGTPVVQLSTRVSLPNIHFREIPNTCDLDVVRGFDEVNTAQGTIRYDTGSATSFGAPSNFLTFRVADGAIGQS